MEKNPKGWFTRGYLPHLDSFDLTQMITFRLADALPQDVILRITNDREFKNNKVKLKYIDTSMDAGFGACYLKAPQVASIVENALWFFHRDRYNLIAWVVMPNHVHVLVDMFNNFQINQIVHSWKSYTSKQINKQLGRTGVLWQREYWDRYIRDEVHFSRAIEYINMNPVKAGLVSNACDWLFSSARFYTMQQSEEYPIGSAGDPLARDF